MKFTNLTRAEEIGANCYLLEAGGVRVLLDAGMHPREAGTLSTPDFSLLEGRGFDAMVLTHAHQDHVGCLRRFQGRELDRLPHGAGCTLT